MQLKIYVIACSLVLVLAGYSFGYGKVKYKNIKGHRVELKWQQVKKNNEQVVEVYGKVRDGKKCEQMTVKVHLDSNKDGAKMVWLEGNINRFKPNQWNKFYAKDPVYAPANFKGSWHVSDVYINCLN